MGIVYTEVGGASWGSGAEVCLGHMKSKMATRHPRGDANLAISIVNFMYQVGWSWYPNIWSNISLEVAVKAFFFKMRLTFKSIDSE